MAAAPSDDDMPQCPLCHMTLESKDELQLHYLWSCRGYDNTEASSLMNVGVRHYGDGGGGYDRSSDRRHLPSSNDNRSDRSSRAAVSGGSESFSDLSQHQVRFLWFPSDPKIQVNKVTLLSSFTAGGGTAELFKSNDNDLCFFASSNVSVRLGEYSDGQIVCGDEILRTELFEVSADSEEVYLIIRDYGQPGPPPAVSTTDYLAEYTDAANYSKYLAEAKKNGMVVKFRHIKVLLTGPPAAGKSSFLNLIFNAMFSDEYSSTDVLKTKQGVLSVKSYSQLQKNNETVWLELDPRRQLQQLKSLLKSRSFSVSSQIVPQKEALHFVIKVPESQTKIDKSIVESPALPDDLRTGDTYNLVSVFDTGGQPEYIALLPAINSVPTINFVIHDLTKKLVDPVLIRYKRAECEEAPSYILHYSNLEMIQLLICLITDSLEQRIVQLPNCIGIPEQSYIGFVGTHYDKVKDDREVLQNVNDLLTCVIKEKSNLRVLSPGNSVIFPVDNTTAGNPETEDPTIKIVRGQIGDLINETKPKELPINWMILQVALQDLHAHKYITYEEYRTIARENASITDEEEVKASLSYFHILGIVVYFGVAELHNIIVTDVKWLFTNLGKIMHLTPKEIKCLDYHLMEKFKKQRLLAKRLLKKIDLGVNEMYYLFNTLVHLKIIATVIIEGVEYYYLPCGLSSTIQYIDRCRFHLSEPLLVQFSSGFLPRGFFSSLVVHLLEQLPQNWTPQFCSNTKHFNNVMTFLLPDETFLRLHDHTYYLEVSVRHFKRDVKASYHHVVLPVLKTYLHRVCRQLNFNLQRLQYGFLCHGDYDTDDHIVTLKTLKVSTPSQLKCSRQPSHTTVIGESHTAWFKKSTDLPLPSRIQNDTSESETSTLLPPLDSMSTLSWQDKKPVMGDLNKIIVPRILASWDDVAYALRYEVHTVNSLREKGHNPKKCCQKLFEDWLTTSNGASPKTYSTLLSKLREVEELTEGIDEIVQKVSKL